MTRRQEHKMEQKQPLQQMALGDLDSYMQKNETRCPTYAIHKNKFKMDKRLKCKSWHNKSPRGDHRQKTLKYYLTLETWVYFWALYSVPLVCVCCYVSTILFWLQCPCNIVWYQILWSLQLCSSFSRLLRLFEVFYGSI